VAAYVAADAAITTALAANPESAAALGLRGTILVALHRFPAARDHAAAILLASPDDPVSLATLGDASLELGDLTAAADAFDRLDAAAGSAATEVRIGRLAFIEGRTTDAVAAARAAVTAAMDEGAEGSALAWYRYQLGEMLLATGAQEEAAEVLDAALIDDPHLPIALGARARIAAADGRLDDAIADLDRAVAAVPLPDLLARRADLYELRAAPGDDRRAADDRATVLAIARLSGDAACVYDRTLSLFLATSRIDVARALRLAEAEIKTRMDVYGYDALGWALLANGRAAEADAALTTALAVGTRDARILYHAGMAAAAVGDAGRAGTLLEDALALDPTFDPVAVASARATLAGLR
jgi:tetratricopeptide (TPR) repeat protein